MDPFYNDRRFYYQPGLNNRRHYPYAVSDRRSDPTQQKRKVVQIPIRFVGSEEGDRSASALKIQKVFRGYLVRKCVEKIREIGSHVDEVEAKLRKDGGLEMVRGDGKERLRLIEGLMSLLFKLDSVKGFDLGVRAYRKAVTRRVIALQELIDSISASTFSSNRENSESKDDETDRNRENAESKDGEFARGPDDVADRNLEGEHAAIEDDGRSDLEVCSIDSKNCSEIPPAIDSTETFRGEDEIRDLQTCGGDNETWDSTCCPRADSSNTDVRVLGEEDSEDTKARDLICDVITKTDSDNIDHHQNEDDESNLEEDDRGSKMEDRELLERIMGDNAKMMRMLTDLCEKNESQSKMIASLAHRVELLEKVFVCERLRKIKNSKKKSAFS